MKHAAEQYALTSGTPTTIVRSTAFLELWIDVLCDTAKQTGRPVVFGRGQNPINFVSASDVAALVDLVLGDRATRGETLGIEDPPTSPSTSWPPPCSNPAATRPTPPHPTTGAPPLGEHTGSAGHSSAGRCRAGKDGPHRPALRQHRRVQRFPELSMTAAITTCSVSAADRRGAHAATKRCRLWIRRPCLSSRSPISVPACRPLTVPTCCSGQQSALAEMTPARRDLRRAFGSGDEPRVRGGGPQVDHRPQLPSLTARSSSAAASCCAWLLADRVSTRSLAERPPGEIRPGTEAVTGVEMGARRPSGHLRRPAVAAPTCRPPVPEP